MNNFGDASFDRKNSGCGHSEFLWFLFLFVLFLFFEAQTSTVQKSCSLLFSNYKFILYSTMTLGQ